MMRGKEGGSNQPGSSPPRGISNKYRKIHPDIFFSKFFKLGNRVLRGEHCRAQDAVLGRGFQKANWGI